ncbi:MAG: ParB/RepB/Spo0J family partition protein [Patescibacteria group bacterium]
MLKYRYYHTKHLRHMSQLFYNDSIFHIDTGKIKPNPYQPRREFDEAKLRELADSIKQYGVLQPLVVTRREIEKEDGGLAVEYELIAGERRLRASRLAGLSQVPVVIRATEDDDRTKLELAIIENLQREDLNPVDRAFAFRRLVDEFGFKHGEIAKKVGKSREYVSNTLRLLILPQEILDALTAGRITEGHARPLMMLVDRVEEQLTLFKEITYKKMTVREAEAIARRIAYDKVRKKDRAFDPEIVEIEEQLQGVLGTRVQIDRREVGGKIMIDFFSNDDLRNLLEIMQKSAATSTVFSTPPVMPAGRQVMATADEESSVGVAIEGMDTEPPEEDEAAPIKTVVTEKEATPTTEDDGLYSVKNFSI